VIQVQKISDMLDRIQRPLMDFRGTGYEDEKDEPKTLDGNQGPLIMLSLS
jgi:hypothetical protein